MRRDVIRFFYFRLVLFLKILVFTIKNGSKGGLIQKKKDAFKK